MDDNSFRYANHQHNGQAYWNGFSYKDFRTSLLIMVVGIIFLSKSPLPLYVIPLPILAVVGYAFYFFAKVGRKNDEGDPDFRKALKAKNKIKHHEFVDQTGVLEQL